MRDYWESRATKGCNAMARRVQNKHTRLYHGIIDFFANGSMLLALPTWNRNAQVWKRVELYLCLYLSMSRRFTKNLMVLPWKNTVKTTTANLKRMMKMFHDCCDCCSFHSSIIRGRYEHLLRRNYDWINHLDQWKSYGAAKPAVRHDKLLLQVHLSYASAVCEVDASVDNCERN